MPVNAIPEIASEAGNSVAVLSLQVALGVINILGVVLGVRSYKKTERKKSEQFQGTRGVILGLENRLLDKITNLELSVKKIETTTEISSAVSGDLKTIGRQLDRIATSSEKKGNGP